MLKIALISDHASPLAVTGGIDAGGQNIYVEKVARHLGALGFMVDVFTRRDAANLPEIVRMAKNVRVIHVCAGPASAVPKENLLPFMPEFARYLRHFFQKQVRPYDLIHANFFMSGEAALLLKAAMDIPLVTTFHALGHVRRMHQGEADSFPDARFDIEQALVSASDRIVAECPQDLSDLVSLYGADPARIEIAPCGFDAAEFSPMNQSAARALLGWKPDEFAILQLGRLVPRKGIDNVIRGLAGMADDKRQRAHLYIVGGNTDAPCEMATPEIARLRSIAREHRVIDQVTFIGRRARPALRAYYSAASVFVTTPWYEPFGITPVEAMACKTAVLGADVGGIKHTVVNERTGLLVPPNDPSALARALERLIDFPGMTSAFAMSGLHRAQNHFTWEHAVAKLTAIYQNAITQHACDARPALALTDVREYASQDQLPLATVPSDLHRTRIERKTGNAKALA